MPVFRIVKNVDAYVHYAARVKANSVKEAVDIAYEGLEPVAWKRRGISEYDACRVMALDRDGNEIDDYHRGKG